MDPLSGPILTIRPTGDAHNAGDLYAPFVTIYAYVRISTVEQGKARLVLAAQRRKIENTLKLAVGRTRMGHRRQLFK